MVEVVAMATGTAAVLVEEGVVTTGVGAGTRVGEMTAMETGAVAMSAPWDAVVLVGVAADADLDGLWGARKPRRTLQD